MFAGTLPSDGSLHFPMLQELRLGVRLQMLADPPYHTGVLYDAKCPGELSSCGISGSAA